MALVIDKNHNVDQAAFTEAVNEINDLAVERSTTVKGLPPECEFPETVEQLKAEVDRYMGAAQMCGYVLAQLFAAVYADRAEMHASLDGAFADIRAQADKYFDFAEDASNHVGGVH